MPDSRKKPARKATRRSRARKATTRTGGKKSGARSTGPKKVTAPPAARKKSAPRNLRATKGAATDKAAAPRTTGDKRLARTIHRRLARAYPDAKTSLDFRSPLELLVATILSAQCTDSRVNQVTKDLFRRYRAAEHYARAPQEELEDAIRSTGFFRSKARAIRGAAMLLVEKHGGTVPDNMEELLALPGVARKTANVVLGSAFGKASGVVVDTHVERVTRRLGLTVEKDPVKIERDLMALLPAKEWVAFGHRVILHGRNTCQARRPDCPQCPLRDLCPSVEF